MAILGRYEIVDKLGAGCMATVYRAHDTVMDREIALKTIRIEAGVEPELRQRYYREARACARLQHRAIVVVYDLGEADDTAYVATELLSGTDLRKLIQQRADIPAIAKVAAMADVCEALGYAHRKGVLHRDVKPGNLFLLDDGQIKVLDFGVTRLFGPGPGVAGQLLGTPNYLAPEEILGRPIDSRADLFAAAVVCFEFLVYAHPFQGEFIPRRILDDPPDSLLAHDSKLPAALEKVLARGLAKNPADRYSTGEEFAADLRGIVEKLKQNAAPAVSVVQPLPPQPTAAPKPEPPAAPVAESSRLSPLPVAEYRESGHAAPTMSLTAEFEVSNDRNGGDMAGANDAPSTNETPEPSQTPDQSAAGMAAPVAMDFEPEPLPEAANQPPLTQPVSRDNCPNCDTANPIGTVYCTECGDRLLEDDGTRLRPLAPLPFATDPSGAGVHDAPSPAARQPQPAPARQPSHKSRTESARPAYSHSGSAQSAAQPPAGRPVSQSELYSQSSVTVAEPESSVEDAEPEPAAQPETDAHGFNGPLPAARGVAAAPAPEKPVFESVMFGIHSRAAAPAPDAPVFARILRGIRTGARRFTAHKPQIDWAMVLGKGNSSQPPEDEEELEKPLFGSLGNSAPAGVQWRGMLIGAIGVIAVIAAGVLLLSVHPDQTVHAIPAAAAHSLPAPAPEVTAPAAPAPPVPAPEAAAPPAPAPTHPTGKIAAARLVYRTNPVYPPNVRRMIARGEMYETNRVLVEATIGPDGHVSAVNVKLGQTLLAQAAKDAVMQWRYKPAMLNGQPVATTIQFQVTFGPPR